MKNKGQKGGELTTIIGVRQRPSLPPGKVLALRKEYVGRRKSLQALQIMS